MKGSLRSPSAWACLLVPLVVGLALDLWTKHEAFARLVRGTGLDDKGRWQVDSYEYDFIEGFLRFQAHVNHGAVFGIGQGQRILFLLVSILAIALLGYLFARSGGQRLYQVLLGILFAGVLGNLFDRMVYGYVRDMIYTFPEWQIFPWIFNIADSLLCTGVGGMFVYSLFKGDEPAAENVVTNETATKSA